MKFEFHFGDEHEQNESSNHLMKEDHFKQKCKSQRFIALLFEMKLTLLFGIEEQEYECFWFLDNKRETQRKNNDLGTQIKIIINEFR